MEKLGNIIEISTANHWEEVLVKSTLIPVFVFKHSTRCGISSYALEQYTNFANDNAMNAECYLIDIIKNRSLSKKIADDTAITHESPQIILIMNRLPVYNDSHRNITEKKLVQNFEKYATYEHR